MVQYERIEAYIEGRKRYTSFKDPAALDDYLQVGNIDSNKFGVEGPGNVFRNHISILGSSANFKAPMPFEVSESNTKLLKTEAFKRVSLVDKRNDKTSSLSIFIFTT